MVTPSASPKEAKCHAPGAVSVSPRIVTADSGAVRREVAGGTYRLTVSGYTWAGVFIPLPASLCDYQVDLDAVLGDPVGSGAGVGWGYGLGACDTWTGASAQGFTIQYAKYEDGQSRVSGNAGWFAMPNVNDGTRVPLKPDNAGHHWIIHVDGRSVTVGDNYQHPIGPYPLTASAGSTGAAASLPKDCENSGIFLRVFNSEADFSGITVQAVKP